MNYIKRIFSAIPLDRHSVGEASAGRSITIRDPRVDILPLHNIVFVPESTGDMVTPISLCNLSISGVGLLCDRERSWAETGAVIFGKFIFQEREYPVSMEIVYVSDRVVGCRFSTADLKNMRTLVLRYFEMELTAQKLTAVSGKYLKKVEDGEPHWLRGANDCELYYVENDDHVVRFDLNFFGHHVDGGENKPLCFGYVVDENIATSGAGVRFKGASLVRPQAAPSPRLVEMTYKFVANISSLPGVSRAQLLAEIMDDGEKHDNRPYHDAFN